MAAPSLFGRYGTFACELVDIGPRRKASVRVVEQINTLLTRTVWRLRRRYKQRPGRSGK